MAAGLATSHFNLIQYKHAFSRPAVNSSTSDMQRRMTCATFSHGISRAMPDVSEYAAANGLEGKSDDEIRDAMGGTTAQKIFDHSGAPRRA